MNGISSPLFLPQEQWAPMQLGSEVVERPQSFWPQEARLGVSNSAMLTIGQDTYDNILYLPWKASSEKGSQTSV